MAANSGNPAQDSFKTLKSLSVGGKEYHYHDLSVLESQGHKVSHLPYSTRILLENLLRHEDGSTVTKQDIESVIRWNPKADPTQEIQFQPARIILQDFTGVPAVADLAAMRAAVSGLGGKPDQINPKQPVNLVIDHSVMVDYFGTKDAFEKNAEIEFERNQERYEFLKWGQNAFDNFMVTPPKTGIVHQVNLECLAKLAMTSDQAGKTWVYPDTLVGTDSHTTMINGLGVVGWGVGGIEAEAAMLGQPITMLVPNVVGFKLTGSLPTGTTATDLVLMVVEMLRKKGVVGKFVEFYGPGLKNLPLADRATIANMAPEYGATIGVFPVDEQTTKYMDLTGRSEMVPLIESYFKAQGLWYDPKTPDPQYSDELHLDLGQVVPSLAGPSRPQDRVDLDRASQEFRSVLPEIYKKSGKDYSESAASAIKDPEGNQYELTHGSVVIAAITSCTNTSNPSVLVAAGLLAQKAVAKGLQVKPWVKTSLAPGSKVVTQYLESAGLMDSLEKLKFNLVGYGCTTCIGNSGPLPDHIVQGIQESDLAVSSVLSGNRNFEGRISPHIRTNYLASPPLVVAYALAGNMNINLVSDPLGQDQNGKDVFLKDIWPSHEEVQELMAKHITTQMYQKGYTDVFDGDDQWKAVSYPKGDLYQWNDKSTYIKQPPFFENMKKQADPVQDIQSARVLALLRDSVTTDHISPAGSIGKDSPAGSYLRDHGVDPKDFNSFGSRRGNHEVMLRGTFGNVRLKNQLVPGVEGGVTRYLPSNEQTSIFEAAMKYAKDGTDLIVIAGKEYGTGSSRDWAAKGTHLLGVKAVIAESFERIHRSNLIGMGVLPLQFINDEGAESLGLNGEEEFTITGLGQIAPRSQITVQAKSSDGSTRDFKVLARIDTPNELEYYKNGGILQYVLRQTI